MRLQILSSSIISFCYYLTEKGLLATSQYNRFRFCSTYPWHHGMSSDRLLGLLALGGALGTT